MHHHKVNPKATSKIFLRPDLTKLQQEADKKLRNELIQMGKGKYKIFQGKIIPRYPVRSKEGLMAAESDQTLGGASGGVQLAKSRLATNSLDEQNNANEISESPKQSREQISDSLAASSAKSVTPLSPISSFVDLSESSSVASSPRDPLEQSKN